MEDAAITTKRFLRSVMKTATKKTRMKFIHSKDKIERDVILQQPSSTRLLMVKRSSCLWQDDVFVSIRFSWKHGEPSKENGEPSVGWGNPLSLKTRILMQNTSATPVLWKLKQVEPANFSIKWFGDSAWQRIDRKKQISYNCNNWRNQTGNFIRQIFTRRGRSCSGWWFQFFFLFTPTWGRFPFWLIFFRWVETTN